MKLYAVMNWKEYKPKITAVNGMPLVMTDKKLLEKIWKDVKKNFPPDVEARIVEFESVEEI